jgi:Rhodopirellula transposase DDE domain
MDCKATVNIGEFSRGGLTRGDNRASDHDMGCQEKYVPCGIVDEASGALHITFGSSYRGATKNSVKFPLAPCSIKQGGAWRKPEFFHDRRWHTVKTQVVSAEAVDMSDLVWR